MAAITHAGTTWNTTAGNKTVTATPAASDLIVVIAGTSGLAGGTTAVSDDQSGTYVQINSDRTGFSTTGVLTAWVRTAFVPAASSTVFTASQAGSTGGGLTVLRISGMDRAGSTAVRSNGGQSSGGAGTTPAPVLNQTPLSANPIISAVCNGTQPGPSITQRTGYAEHQDTGYNTPATGLAVNSLDSGETSATITYGGTSATAFASVAIELDSSAFRDPAPVIDGTIVEQEELDGVGTTTARDVANDRAVWVFVTHNNSSAATITSALTDNSASITPALVLRMNTQQGTTAEVYFGYNSSGSTVSGYTVTATGNNGGTGTLTRSHIVLAVFSNAEDTAAGATNSASSASGLPSAAVTTTRIDSWCWAVKADWSAGGSGTPNSGQEMVHTFHSAGEYTSDVWRKAEGVDSGSSVTLNETAPSAQNFNMVLVEIRSPAAVAAELPILVMAPPR